MVIFKHIFILTYMKAVNLCCADKKRLSSEIHLHRGFIWNRPLFSEYAATLVKTFYARHRLKTASICFKLKTTLKLI